MSWIVFVLGLALIGLVTFLVASRYPTPGQKVEAALADKPRSSATWWDEYYSDQLRNREAWRFWSWCNAVYLRDMEANPPPERAIVKMSGSGMWVVKIYDGAKSWREEVCGELGLWTAPEPSPDGYHSYRQIGPSEGFTSRQAAQVFLRGYQREIVRKDPNQ